MADIPVNASDAVTIVSVVVNGQINFDYDFRADFVVDLKAEYRPAGGGAVTILVGGTDFTATGLETAAGGTITLLTFPTVAGDSMAIYRDITVERGTDFTRDLFSDDINAEQDRIFMILQEIVRDLARGIRLPLGYTGNADLVPEDGTIIGWDGDDLVNLDPAEFIAFDPSILTQAIELIISTLPTSPPAPTVDRPFRLFRNEDAGAGTLAYTYL